MGDILKKYNSTTSYHIIKKSLRDVLTHGKLIRVNVLNAKECIDALFIFVLLNTALAAILFEHTSNIWILLDMSYTWRGLEHILANKNINKKKNILMWVKSFAIFWYMSVCITYITWLKQINQWQVLVISSTMVVGVLTCCPLLSSMCNLKAAQINVNVAKFENICLTSLNWTLHDKSN